MNRERAKELLPIIQAFAVAWDKWSSDERGEWIVLNVINGKYTAYEDCDPFYSGDHVYRECLSRRQADALEDWLTLNHYPLWNRSELDAESPEKPYSENGAFWYQHRRNKLKWCFEQLEKDNG